MRRGDVAAGQPGRERRRARAGQGPTRPGDGAGARQEARRRRPRRRHSGTPTVPAVFVGGDLVGGTNRVMALHLAGELVPMLMNAGARWV